MNAQPEISGNDVADAIEAERHTYGEWQSMGRQVKKGERRGSDGRFAFGQTKVIGSPGRAPRTCGGCGCRINYGRFCGKCEYR